MTTMATTAAAGAQVETTQVYRVYIRATAQAVWDAITQPDWTERFGYGGRADYDLRPGGAYRGLASQAMRDAGAPELAVDGEVLEVDPPRRLVQTWRMVMDERLKEEGFTRLTYELEEVPAGVTRLTVVHELGGKPQLSLLLSGGMEKQGAGGGWSWVLSSLKTLLETGESMQHDMRRPQD